MSNSGTLTHCCKVFSTSNMNKQSLLVYAIGLLFALAAKASEDSTYDDIEKLIEGKGIVSRPFTFINRNAARGRRQLCTLLFCKGRLILLYKVVKRTYKPAVYYSQLSLNGHLYKTDTSMRRTPGVGPCAPFFSHQFTVSKLSISRTPNS